MSKKTDSRIYRLENFKNRRNWRNSKRKADIRFNNDKLTPWAKKSKTFHAIKTKMGH